MSDSVTSKDYYFDSYAHFGIHEEMLKDKARTVTYMHAILNNKHLFKDKIVLDVGCGTGILSMFAAKAGASRVFGVECSAIATQAEQIVAENGMSDVITIIKGKMEDIKLPVDYVDIIISEWMGYFLLYESMLPTVIFARDKYLRPDTGIILPDKANLYLSCVTDETRDDKIEFWNDVYGFSMKSIKNIVLSEPLVESFESRSMIANSSLIFKFDLLRGTVNDLTFASNFEIVFNRNDYCHAFLGFFECEFSQIHKPLFLSTSPRSVYTHWRQTAFYLENPLTVCNGEIIRGTISVCPNRENPRDLDIQIESLFDGKHSSSSENRLYKLR